jgi:hypothetical protein
MSSSDFEALGLGLIELKWQYMGSEIKTLGIVSDKQGIIYDNLLYFVHYDTSPKEQTSTVFYQIPRLKSGQEVTNISYRFNIQRFEHRNVFGVLVAYVDGYIIVNGQLVNGEKQITTQESKVDFNAHIGYTATGSVTVTGQQLGANGYYTFAYAVAVGIGSFSPTWTGTGFTIPSGVQGTAGTLTVIPSNLN